METEERGVDRYHLSPSPSSADCGTSEESLAVSGLVSLSVQHKSGVSSSFWFIHSRNLASTWSHPEGGWGSRESSEGFGDERWAVNKHVSFILRSSQWGRTIQQLETSWSWQLGPSVSHRHHLEGISSSNATLGPCKGFCPPS